MIIRKAMYGCGLYFFIKLAYNSPILCKFAQRHQRTVPHTSSLHDIPATTIIKRKKGNTYSLAK